MNPQSRKSLKSKIFKLVIILLIFAAISAFFLNSALAKTKKLSQAAKEQDLDSIKQNIEDTKGEFKKAQVSLIVFTPLRIIPFFGWYIADVQRGVNSAVSGLEAAQVLTEAITPYADVLGLKGQGTFLGGTAQERLAAAVQTLSKVAPQLNEVAEKLTETRGQIDDIAAWRYPNFLPGKPGEKIETAKQTIDQLESLLTEARPLVEVLPEIMGSGVEKRYLILFQNDAELRSTGGFLTAYGYFKVKDGIVESEGSSDIYQLDATLTRSVPAPGPILQYLPDVPTFNIRDSNISPDFLVSMKQFEELYKNTSANQDIDGIIALDTKFVLKMIEVLGPIEAQGTKFTTDLVEACACPHIIYELEKYADEPVTFERGDRKGIIGVLMQEMMTMTFNAPKSKWPILIGAVLDSFNKKHLLTYFKDAKVQEAVEKINFAGRIYEYEGDYLHINDTNFAGAKSNLYLEQKVKQQIKEEKDKVVKKLTIEYKYPRRADNCSLERRGGLCLAGIYRDWIRIYVPEGSVLTKASGTEQAFTTGEDLGKTVFEAFFTLRPEGALKIEVEYTVPLEVNGQYKLLIQKQPGTPGHIYEIEAFGKKQRPFELEGDKELIVKT